MKRIYLYRNLHTGTFSLKTSGRVFAHPKSCEMTSVIFKVSEKGQARVRKEKRKNVHATVASLDYIILKVDPDLTEMDEVYYNPYTVDYFTDIKGNRVDEAETVICHNNKIYIKTKD